MYFDAESNESLVRARPKTGRTHQIRLHLQYLGFPIVNDPIYNDPVFGAERFEREKQKELSENDVFEGIKETRGWGDTMYKIDKEHASRKFKKMSRLRFLAATYVRKFFTIFDRNFCFQFFFANFLFFVNRE